MVDVPPAQPGVLYDVLGLAEGPEHAVGEADKPRPLLFEDAGRIIDGRHGGTTRR